MRNLAALAVLLLALAAPASAQVINGETPLDETTLNRETPGPDTTRPPQTAQPSAEPAHPETPRTSGRD